MSTYAIGDLQGCDSQLSALLHKITALHAAGRGAETAGVAAAGAADVDANADADADAAADIDYLFVGDIVNRGPQSLQTLRHIRALGARAKIVLGNHDLHLLAAAHGIRKPGRNDTLDAILQAPDRDALLDWLRRQPLARLHAGHLVVHAGVLPQWSVEQTLALAAEVEQALGSADWVDFLRHMYGNLPAKWDDRLRGRERLRCIVNALTRMRLCHADGSMILDDAQAADADEAAATPAMPWFDVPGRRTADITVVFGHWSALGLQTRADLIGLDTGCVWGGKLTAVRLGDRAMVQVDCPQYQAPGKSA